MIPDLINIGAPFDVLPPGIHAANLTEVEECFGYNQRRRILFNGLIRAATNLRDANCSLIYLDGSFVTAKPYPGDYDACWDPNGVDTNLLDPVLLDFENRRQAQKDKFEGEFLPLFVVDGSNQTFVDFFQTEKFTGGRKGILSIAIGGDAYLEGVNCDDH